MGYGLLYPGVTPAHHYSQIINLKIFGGVSGLITSYQCGSE